MSAVAFVGGVADCPGVELTLTELAGFDVVVVQPGRELLRGGELADGVDLGGRTQRTGGGDGGVAPKLPVNTAALETTALVPSPDFVAIRLPDPVEQWRLGDDLLVVAPKGTRTLTASNGATPVHVDDGVWLVKAPPPATVTLTANPGGTTVTVTEPHAPGILFDQPVGPLW